MMSEQMIFLLVVGGLLLLLVALTSSKRYSLNRIKAKTVGDGPCAFPGKGLAQRAKLSQGPGVGSGQHDEEKAGHCPGGQR